MNEKVIKNTVFIVATHILFRDIYKLNEPNVVKLTSRKTWQGYAAKCDVRLAIIRLYMFYRI
ncbi:MAG: hypothetical protein ABIF17_02310 [Patescibacteria group bacterium]